MKTPQEIYDTLFCSYPALEDNREEILAAAALLSDCAQKGGTVYCCGNGGSAADCEHIVGELMKGFNRMRPLSPEARKKFAGVAGGDAIAAKLQGAVRAVSLVSQSGLISAFANDIDPALVYAQQIWAYANNPADVLIALSTSGNSVNVLNAAKTALAVGIRTVAITGETGGALRDYANVTVALPANTPYEVQELTLPVYHALCAGLEAALFPV